MKPQLSLLALALAITACRPIETPDTPTAELPATVIATATPKLPTGTVAPPTKTPVPPTDTPQPTATVQPQVWEIWFNGYSCEALSDCNPVPGLEYKFYSIKSDGTDLRELTITDFPPIPALPKGAPPLKRQGLSLPPLLSPDGSALMYLGDDGKLYLVNPTNGEVLNAYGAVSTNAAIGPYCWVPDATGVKFLEMAFRETPVMYLAKRDGHDVKRLFDLPEVQGIMFGICSPDNQEMAVSVPIWGDKSQVGLYLINTNNGEVRKLLGDYSVWAIRYVER